MRSSLLLASLAAWALPAALPAPAQELDPDRLADAIADLAADDFEARQAATALLIEAGPSARDALEDALEGAADPEVARRLEHVLERIEWSPAAVARRLAVDRGEFWHPTDGPLARPLPDWVDLVGFLEGTPPETRLRVHVLLVLRAGNGRFEPDQRSAVAGAFRVLESSLDRPEVRRFAPERGFSHFVLSGNGPTLLLDRIPDADRSAGAGLNLVLDDEGRFVRARAWGALE